ncbi:hypothetical protein B9Z19DRAFT_1067266 [Tuber borchii]|uniref:ABC transporter domain-containing protein n=1 Tax=Tuber borchii TaxID=42251 RepID=A0A2T6ZJL2_TUBBO|nr:hypothetical protein B9Z19DRAFT_1067266 [Tuber borchii]
MWRGWGVSGTTAVQASSLKARFYGRRPVITIAIQKLPTPHPGQVLGLVGTNGIGKSTALKILSRKQKPNLGRYDNPPDWNETLAYFRGSELQNYLKKVVEDNIKAVVKHQYVDKLPLAIRGTVRGVNALLKDQCARGDEVMEAMIEVLDLRPVLDREVERWDYWWLNPPQQVDLTG